VRERKEVQILLRTLAVSITENYRKLQEEVPDHVTIVAAAKTRAAAEIAEAIDAGVRHVGENYVQEAERAHAQLGARAASVSWHMIGHLQDNKINKALRIFHMVQTVDSRERAEAINRRAAAAEKILPILIEINIGAEQDKSGIAPDENLIETLVRDAAKMGNLRVRGLMTMGPLIEDAERLRPYFRRTRELFERIRSAEIEGVQFDTLSMGMSGSYRVAVEEGATMIRVGTVLFGPRGK
jgi:pyridoxal phosphate enzyme (YggS family)